MIPQAERPATDRQIEVLRAIEGFIAAKGYSPSIRELMELLDINSPNGVCCHLNALQTKGLITWDRAVHRTIRVVKA